MRTFQTMTLFVCLFSGYAAGAELIKPDGILPAPDKAIAVQPLPPAKNTPVPPKKNSVLTFRMLPEKDVDETKSVLCAGGNYSCESSLLKKGFEFSASISGVLSFPKEDGDAHITYIAEVTWGREEVKSSSRIEGSVLLRYDTPIIVGVVGKRELEVTLLRQLPERAAKGGKKQQKKLEKKAPLEKAETKGEKKREIF